MLFLMSMLASMIVMPSLIIGFRTSMHFIDRARAQSLVEGAGLIAANSISRLIVEDDHFGFVGLSNFPPIGQATCAPDGEPLPVTGINTLTGTIRQCDCVAQTMQNPYIRALVAKDAVMLDRTVANLNKELKRSMSQDDGEPLQDIHGKPVTTLLDVKKYLAANTPDYMELVNVSLENGYLIDKPMTQIACPKPEQWAQLKYEQKLEGKYRAFTDVSTHDNRYHFAAIGSTASLVDKDNFASNDPRFLNTIIKVTCTYKLQNLGPNILPPGMMTMDTIKVSACAQPYSLPDLGPKGIMTLRFTGTQVGQMRSFGSFLTEGTFQDRKITTYDVTGGDYPRDEKARMVQVTPEVAPSTTQQFSEHFYYWLRNGHLLPHMDKVIEMLGDDFHSEANQIIAFEFTHDGRISRRILEKDPFPIGVTSESQLQTVADTSLRDGVSPVIIFRNDVKNLGITSGGKHCGQPLEGFPLNWCELDEYGGDEHIARGLGKGRLGTNLLLIDPTGSASLDEAVQDATRSPFRTIEGSPLAFQPRRSFYSGGLALDIEIGGIKASTAKDDVSRMQTATRGREI